MVDFNALRTIYNTRIDSILAYQGLSSECKLNFGVTKRDLCPNCIYDVNLKKSSGKFKTGGPISFTTGMVCPYCHGIGFLGDEVSETIYMAIIWNYKEWITTPDNIENPNGFIQAIGKRSNLAAIRRAKDMSIVYPFSDSYYPKFQLFSEPTPCGLGDNNYIVSVWKKNSG
jgi:hypothetical protein